jgi:hypothetical protein
MEVIGWAAYCILCPSLDCDNSGEGEASFNLLVPREQGKGSILEDKNAEEKHIIPEIHGGDAKSQRPFHQSLQSRTVRIWVLRVNDPVRYSSTSQ